MFAIIKHTWLERKRGEGHLKLAHGLAAFPFGCWNGGKSNKQGLCDRQEGGGQWEKTHPRPRSEASPAL